MPAMVVCVPAGPPELEMEMEGDPAERPNVNDVWGDHPEGVGNPKSDEFVKVPATDTEELPSLPAKGSDSEVVVSESDEPDPHH